MTFCFAFSANPDGIAVIADTRISKENHDFSDGYQKVIFPTDDAFIAVSGVIGPLRFLLNDIAIYLRPIAFGHRIDFLRTHLRKRYVDGLNSQCFTGSMDDAFLIYGDIRSERGPTRCRLVCFRFQFSDGQVIFGEETAPNFGYLAIGSTRPTRRFLSNTAAESLYQLEQRSLVLKHASNEDVLRMSTGGRVPYQSLDIRCGARSASRSAVILDSTGPKTGTFRKSLRAYANAQQEPGLEPIQVFGIAALQAIIDQVSEFRSPPSDTVETISDTWTLATVSRRYGVRLFTGDDPNGVLQKFGLNRALN